MSRFQVALIEDLKRLSSHSYRCWIGSVLFCAITLKVNDEIGREIAAFLNENKGAGKYNVQLNGSGLASGIYYYRINAGNFSKVKKLMLLKINQVNKLPNLQICSLVNISIVQNNF